MNDELEKLQHEYQDVLNNKKASLKELNNLRRQINLRAEKIQNISTEVRNLDNQISENNNTVHSLQTQLDQLKKEYEGMVLFAYRNKSAYNKLMFIFASKDFNQAYKRLKYLQQFATYRERQASYIQGTQNDLHVKIIELDRTKEEKHKLLAVQEKEKATLGKQRKSEESVVKDLSKRGGVLQEKQKEIQARRRQIDRAIDNAIRKEIAEAERKAAEKEKADAAARVKSGIKDAPATKSVARRSSSESLNATPEAAKLSNDFLSNKGSLPWPVANGEPTHGMGTYTIKGIKMDANGMGIRTNAGAAVRSIFNGEVALVDDTGGSITVLIQHGEYFTGYSNLRTVNVSKGQKVSTKQSIGTAALDEISGDNEFEFLLYKGQTPINPKVWLAPNN
ncbi:MAG: peptidoglycan DD-metalloendopeptidase family protein [Mucilaginibacter sp.]